jgi:hypothetical protein
MRIRLLCPAILLALSSAAVAQSAPPSPPASIPGVAPGDRPSDYLRAAQGALALGHEGEAEEALEMAQTRMLDRSVPLGQTDRPSDNPTVGQISQAMQALAAHDRLTGMQAIQRALVSASAQGQ